MDDLLREFLTETNESLDMVDVELVRFEQEPNNAKFSPTFSALFTPSKAPAVFSILPRLEALAHAAETLMGKFRDGLPVTQEAVTLILPTIDRIKEILETLEREQREPEGDDADLIDRLHGLASALTEPSQTEGGPQLRTAANRRHADPSGAGASAEARRGHASTNWSVRSAKRQRRARRAGQADRRAGSKDDDGRRKAASQSIRVSVDTLEHLMTMVSELVLTRNQLLEISRRHEESEFKMPLQRLSNVTAELQEGVMKTRMQPIGNAWQKLPRIVRDLASDLGKQIELEMHGAETELDRQVLDLIKDPLTHMVRNSADHGLETTAERRAAGKPERGTIRLARLSRRRPHHRRDRRRWARPRHREDQGQRSSRGDWRPRPELDKLSEAQIHKFIFAPGFSTAATVTNISGRGVGMDVVRSNIDQIGGTIDVKSVSGAGVIFTIKIPLTLAIVSALIVEAGGERFAIPQLSVMELVRAARQAASIASSASRTRRCCGCATSCCRSPG